MAWEGVLGSGSSNPWAGSGSSGGSPTYASYSSPTNSPSTDYGSYYSGSPTTYTAGGTANQGMAGATNYLADIAMPAAQNANWGLQAQQSAYNQGQNAINDYIQKYNAQQDQLNMLNSVTEQGYNNANQWLNPIANFMPELGAQYDRTVGAGNQYQAAYQNQADAYQNIVNGVVPQATQDMIDQRYGLEYQQTANNLNDSFKNQQTNLLDNLGQRGILNGSTSQGAVTGLGTNLLKSLQDASQTYGIERINALLQEPYNQFGAANTLAQQAGGVLSGQQGTMSNAIMTSGALNQNANTAQADYQALLDAVNQQAGLGQTSLSNIGQIYNMAQGLAPIGQSVYEQAWGPATDIWSQLLNNETARITSANAASAQKNAAKGNATSSIIGALGSVLGSLF